MSIRLLNFANGLLQARSQDSHALEREESRIDINKPYKPRKLKTDQYHRMMREAEKHKPSNTSKEMEHKRTRQHWEQENKVGLKKRADFVRKQKKLMNLK